MGIEEIALSVWPTSIELMALDTQSPPPWSAIVFVYGFSILGNVGIYGMIGLVVGLIVRGFNKRQEGITH